MSAGSLPIRNPIATLLIALVVLACAGPPPVSSPAPASVAPSASADAPSPTPEPSPASVDGAFGSVPTACLGLGETDCRRVAGHVAQLLTGADPRVRYVQIGPFSCAREIGCPTTLAARPEGDVLVETATGTLSFHVTGRAAGVDVRAQEAFGIMLAPTTRPPLPIVPQPLALGHCGLWSGIDVGGSWWDPVGAIDGDHGDAINAAEGTFTPVGPGRATFTSKAGLVVQLLRRDGEKYLPLCQ